MPEDRRDTLGDALDHFEQYLGLIALAALVLGAIGVASAVHAHVSRRVPTVAILRCLGCPTDLAFSIYLAQAVALGALGALLGSLVAVSHGLVLAARRFIRPTWPYLVRQGISNLYRPQNQTLLFLLSLGLGTFLLEEGLAKDLRVGLDDELVLDVQGVPVRARITSLRKVDWSHFNLNFFMVFPPGVLEGAPGFHVLTTRVPAGMSSGDLQRALVEKFPNVTAIDLTLILATIREMLDKLSRVVSVLAGFTVAAGLPILIGTLLNGRDQRLRESVLLRTLGASARQVRVILTIEYVTLGALSALAGVLLAVAANSALALVVFDGTPWPDPLLLAVAFAAVMALTLLGGLALSRGVCRYPPLEILRSTAQPGPA